MKTLAIIQARLGSSRLPGKVLMDLAGRPVLSWVLRAAQHAKTVDEVWIASPDPELVGWALENDCNGMLGSEDDVLGRFQDIVRRSPCDRVVRLTADCPFLDPSVIDLCVRHDASTTEHWPDGMDVQVLRPEHLERGDREHVVAPWLVLSQLGCLRGNLRHVKLSLDTQGDLELLRSIAVQLPKNRPPHWYETLDALRALQEAA